MKNALILTGVWLGILVTAYAIVFWDQGMDRPLPISVLEHQAELSEPDFVHPDELFSVSAPMGWHVENGVDIARMTDPNEDVTVQIVFTQSSVLDDVLDEVFTLAGVGDDYSRIASVSLPMGEWLGNDVSVTYRSESADDVIFIRVQRPEDWTLALIAQGKEQMLDVLSDNLEWIWSEVEIPAATAKLL